MSKQQSIRIENLSNFYGLRKSNLKNILQIASVSGRTAKFSASGSIILTNRPYSILAQSAFFARLGLFQKSPSDGSLSSAIGGIALLYAAAAGKIK